MVNHAKTRAMLPSKSPWKYLLLLIAIYAMIKIHIYVERGWGGGGEIRRTSKLVSWATTFNSKKAVAIYTFQSNEGSLLLDWGMYHGSIFGFSSLHIIDHISVDNETIDALQLLEDKGANIRLYYGSFAQKHAELSGWMSESDAEFYIPIDVDEFLVLWRENNLTNQPEDIQNHFQFLPRDGRRYRMTSISAMSCESKTPNEASSLFRRTHQMTTFIKPENYLGCMSKSFFWAGSFLHTDQGNHGGATTQDGPDMEHNYSVKGCPYFHSPNIALVHYGDYLPWELYQKKMIRGASLYNHTRRVDAGERCSDYGVHYCRFYKNLLKKGEAKARKKYEKDQKSICNSADVFQSHAIVEAIELAEKTPHSAASPLPTHESKGPQIFEALVIGP